MIGKITSAVAVALLLGSASVASAQTDTRAQRNGTWQAPFAEPYYDNSYFNEDYWRAVAPFGAVGQPDPYAGTIWEGVAPY
jgi:hypothetical protein